MPGLPGPVGPVWIVAALLVTVLGILAFRPLLRRIVEMTLGDGRAVSVLEEANRSLLERHERLREVDRLKSEYVVNVSHELRTPLTLILGPVERMLESGTLLPLHRRQAEAIHRNALQLLAHVEDLLEAATLEQGVSVVHDTEVDLAHLLRRVTSRFEVLAADRQIGFEVEAPEALAAHLDRSKTERIVLNLLSNAFRFTEPGGSVRVALHEESSDADDPRAVLVVEDDGPGVPEHLRDAVFEPFRRAAGAVLRQAGGPGLGLSIARDFARMQGGSVALTSSELGGARFEVRLPAAPAPASAAGPLFESSAAGRAAASEPDTSSGWMENDPRPKVLVVEPHAGVRAYLEEVLEMDFDCSCVADGRSALKRVRETVPDLILTGLMLPDLDGEDLLHQLRRLLGREDVPILVITARAEPDLAARLLQSGAQDYMVKPVHAGELLARARNLVTAATARTTLRRRLSESLGRVASVLELELFPDRIGPTEGG